MNDNVMAFLSEQVGASGRVQKKKKENGVENFAKWCGK